MSTIEVNPTQTGAWVAQAWISFGVSFGSVLVGTAYLPVETWVRAFLALGVLYTVTSTFTLAKTVRDQHETSRVVSRIDEAKIEKFLADHDPLRSVV